MEIQQLVALPSRTGRHLQRFNQELRQVVGCVPYRIRKSNKCPLIHGISVDDLEILLISSQKSPRMMLPKGGWELDENIKFAALRETMEEAGVVGMIGEKLGKWIFKSKSQEKYHEGTMFALLVTEELDNWPEKHLRQRTWMTVNEAREACTQSWMKETLDAFVSHLPRVEKEHLASCRLSLSRSEDLRCGIVAQNADYDVVDSCSAVSY